MSGIFGIFNRDGAPVDRTNLQAMHDVFAQWFDDDRGIWCEDDVGIGHTMLWNTPESKLETLPLVDGPMGRRLVIAADVRLDNRAELIEKLSIHQPLDTVTDSYLLLAAYRKWGEDSPGHLLGDFAYVVWDEAEQKLSCVRDHIGIKPFYYSLCAGCLIFSNDIRPIITHPNFISDINEQSVASYLRLGELVDAELTFYKNILKLPPANSLVVSSTEVRQSCYWYPEKSPIVTLPNLEAYSARLRELLEDAVKVRLRSNYEVGAHLSGGLDSSAITAIAAPVLKATGKALHTYNWMYPVETDVETNNMEWAAGTVVANHCDVPIQYTDLCWQDILGLLHAHNIAFNDTVDLCYEFAVRKSAANRGTRVMLSGWGGDQLITHSGRTANADLFWHGKIWRALRNVCEASRFAPRPWKRFLGSCYREIFRPVLGGFAPKEGSPWDAGFLAAASADVAEQARRQDSIPVRLPVISVRNCQLSAYYSGYVHSRLESWASSSHCQKIEYRYPLLDKRIVEYAMGIPASMYWQQGRSRFLFRHAVSFMLPESIAWGELKQEPSRVNRLGELELVALKQWLEDISTSTDSVADNSDASEYIERQRLYGLIRSLSRNGACQSDQQMHRIDTAIKSVFALKL